MRDPDLFSLPEQSLLSGTHAVHVRSRKKKAPPSRPLAAQADVCVPRHPGDAEGRPPLNLNSGPANQLWLAASAGAADIQAVPTEARVEARVAAAVGECDMASMQVLEPAARAKAKPIDGRCYD
jgi:hypothetical protein